MLNDPASVPWKTIEESRELAWNGPGFDGITMGMEFWKPIIAVINGYCIAGGNEIALACDIRIAAEHAEFGHQEVRWCMIPGDGGCQEVTPGGWLRQSIGANSHRTENQRPRGLPHRAGKQGGAG